MKTLNDCRLRLVLAVNVTLCVIVSAGCASIGKVKSTVIPIPRNDRVVVEAAALHMSPHVRSKVLRKQVIFLIFIKLAPKFSEK
jgi:hypothetical protein